MADSSDKRQAEAQFKKAQRADEGRKAMAEYEAHAAAVRANTERLRALRLARDEAAAAAAPAAAVPAKKAAKKKKTAPAKLPDWLKGQQDGGRNN